MNPAKFARDILWVGVAQLFNSIIVGVGTMPALTKYYPLMFMASGRKYKLLLDY